MCQTLAEMPGGGFEREVRAGLIAWEMLEFR